MRRSARRDTCSQRLGQRSTVHGSDPPRDMRAAVDNADRLLRDASTLLAAGSAPSAHSLAVLALEEIGKAIICCGGFAGSDNTVTTRERFDRECLWVARESHR